MGARRGLATASAVLFLLTGLVVARAYVVTGGAGSGQAGTVTSVSGVLIDGEATTAVAPGAPVSLSGWFYNGNEFPVQVTGVDVTIIAVVGASTCATDDFKVTNATPSDPWVVPAGETRGWEGASIEFIDDPHKNQDDCLNRSVRLMFDVTA